MTEAGWLKCVHPEPMLAFLRGKASNRKLWLFAAACYRSPGVWPCLRGQKQLKAGIWAVEQAVDGQGPVAGDPRLLELNERDISRAAADSSGQALSYAAGRGFEGVNLEWADGHLVEASNRQFEQEEAYQCALLRCIFGNPFRPTAVDPGWRTADAAGLARAAYHERVFGHLGVLADALLDAGCADQEVLSHCWASGPHVPGCWVLDLVLGKV